MRNFARLVALPLFLLAILSGCGREKAVANVDGESITMEEFNQYLATKPTVRVKVQGQVVDVPVAENLGFQALQELATQKIVIAMAKEAGLAPTDEEIDKEIDFKKALNPGYLNDQKNAGRTLGQIRRETAYALCEERLLTRGTNVGMEEIEKMIEDQPDQFIEPASADVYQIFVLSADKKKLVDAELKAGQTFKAVSGKYNQSPNGSKIRVRPDRLAEPVKSVISKSQIGSTTAWVEVSGGFNKFYIESKTEAKAIEMTAERKETLRRQLAVSRGRQANDLGKEVAERLRKADVLVSDDEETLKDLWKRFQDRLEKVAEEEPKTEGQD